MLPDRISAVIIKDKKILLVTNDINLYWTPGGTLEAKETHEQALKRELMEELSVQLKSSKPYIHYTAIHEFKKVPQRVFCYFAEYVGELIPSSEITIYGWFSKDNLPRMIKSIKDNLIQKLIEDKLL